MMKMPADLFNSALSVRVKEVSKPTTEGWMLYAMSGDDYRVLRAISVHPNINEPTINILLNKHRYVRLGLISNPKVSIQLLARLGYDRLPLVRKMYYRRLNSEYL